MKGLSSIPSEENFLEAYRQLQARPARRISEAELALWSQWCRFDPRLGEQLIELLGREWRTIHPMRLREEALRQPWPQALGVLLEQVLDAGWIPRPDRTLYRRWRDTVLAEIRPASGELFFIGTRKLAGKQMLLDAELSLRAYLKWGYLGRELLVNKAQAPESLQRTGTLLPPLARKRILSQLMRQHPRFSVEDYRRALGFQVSRRQAELDLAALVKARRLSTQGQTRGRIYRVRRHG